MMNSAQLTTAIVTRLFPLWRAEPPEASANDNDYFLTQFARIISEEVVRHIQQNAKAVGQDTRGDGHDLDVI